MTLSDTLELARWIGQASGLLEGLAIGAPPHVQQAVAKLLAATPKIQAAQPPDPSALARELRAEIMNLRCVPPLAGYCFDPANAYGQGFSDAALAAADLILSRLSPAAGVDALYPDNLNADLAHRLSCVAHDCCVNGRMRHDVGLKLVRVVRDFMRLVHSPAAPEAAAERVYEWQGRRCVIRHYQDTAVWIGDDANENWSRFYLSKDGEWKDALPPKVTVFDSWPTRQSALAFLENLTKGTP